MWGLYLIILDIPSFLKAEANVGDKILIFFLEYFCGIDTGQDGS